MSATIEALMNANLLEVFGERDSARRADAIGRVYTDDVEFLDPDEVVRGHQALNDKAQKLLDGAPGFVFAPAGPIYVVHDMGYLAWAFGHEGGPPVVSGVDACFVRDGRIAKVYTLLLRD